MVGKVWGKRVEKKYAKIAWGLGRDRVVKITVYLFLVYPMIGQLWQFTSTLLRQSLASGTQSLANMNMSSMSNPWRFDICFSESGLGRQIEVFKKTLTGSSPSLLPPFFARSLFHCSLGFFARLHWRRSARASLQIFCLTTARDLSAKYGVVCSLSAF